MAASDKTNVHKGHRERMKRRFIDKGMDSFEQHEALEMYLYYAIPRKDTNPLAHRLLERYLTIGAVCDAPIDELEHDFGLSESAAVLLKLLPDMARLYSESKLTDEYSIDLDSIGDIMKTKFIGRTTEVVALLLGDAQGKMIFFDVIAKGSLTSSDMPIRRICDLALRHNARTAFVAHNHPSGSSLPSQQDLKATEVLYKTLRNLGISLMDHFIVTSYECLSMRENYFFQKFDQ